MLRFIALLFRRWRSFPPLLLLLFLSACGGHLHHVVEPGETLHSISFLYGYDYHQLARWNGIGPPYRLKAGQTLRVAPPDANTSPSARKSPVQKSPVKISPRPAGKPAVVVESVASHSTSHTAPRSTPRSTPQAIKKPPAASYQYSRKTPHWRWPVNNPKVLRHFSANDPGRQGVSLTGRRGDPVYAAAAGKVVYAGSGLVRYGRLIIIKHNEKYLSAYAHNDKLRVKEGDVVKAGQRIADVGNSGTQRPMLHFEIRRNGKPVNPLRYLPKR